MNLFMLLTETGAEAANPFDWTFILLIGGMAVAMYFLMIRPNRKKEKEAKELRENLEVGDGIVTIGGIVGRIVSIKEDTVLIETGSDRTKIRMQKGAIGEVEKLDDITGKDSKSDNKKDAKKDSKQDAKKDAKQDKKK